MKIKRYIGKTVQEAMDKAKMDLGQDAVILNTKKIRRPGLSGLFGKKDYELTAACQLESRSNLTGKKDQSSEDNSIIEIKNELEELKNLLIEMPSNLQEKNIKLHPNIKVFHRILVSNGVDYKIDLSLLEKIVEEVSLDDKDEDMISNLVKYQLKKTLGNPEPISVGDGQKVVFFVGPTGVGKTTTLAKIASSLVMENKYDIGLITSDTYRVGAVEQLKTYSDILNLDLEIAYSKEDMISSYNKFKEKDIILVDTAGRNHNSEEQTDELKKILYAKNKSEIYLLISGSSDMRNLENLVTKYNFLGDYKLIVTKLDESDNFGALINIRYLFDREISYYTMGQNVPEDIRILNTDYIADKLIEER